MHLGGGIGGDNTACSGGVVDRGDTRTRMRGVDRVEDDDGGVESGDDCDAALRIRPRLFISPCCSFHEPLNTPTFGQSPCGRTPCVYRSTVWDNGLRSLVVEHSLRKGKATGSIPVEGFFAALCSRLYMQHMYSVQLHAERLLLNLYARVMGLLSTFLLGEELDIHLLSSIFLPPLLSRAAGKSIERST